MQRLFCGLIVVLAQSQPGTDDALVALLKDLFSAVQRYGFFGSFAVIAVLLWWQWPTIKDRPGVASATSWMARRASRVTSRRLPTARGDRFSVAIVHLVDDEDHRAEMLLKTSLSDFTAVETLSLNREITEEGDAGHEHARRLLREVEADAMIWGRVLRFPGSTVPKLYWTLRRDVAPKKASEHYRPTEELKLPEVFWEDLKNVIQLLIATAAADINALEGQYTAEYLSPFVARVMQVLATANLTLQRRAPIEFILGDTLTSLGDQTGDNECLHTAISAYQRALLGYDRDNASSEWAMTQNNLGTALTTLGERENDSARLQTAVEAYRNALLERPRERVPLRWATTQNNLGNALRILGERENDSARLQAAIEAYQNALLEYTRERVPLQWARTQNNLGNGLSTLGRREDDSARLQAAVEAYRNALLERTRERVPLQWATTQNNLGNALSMLGERENDSARLQAAVEAYQNALLERTRERVPLQWATTQNNLGNALTILGERESDSVRLQAAVEAYRNALLEVTLERVPLRLEQVKANLQFVFRLLEEYGDSRSQLDS
jgi:tetratricopeptide (TPR) repeat protein